MASTTDNQARLGQSTATTAEGWSLGRLAVVSALAATFLASGFSALLYQVVWQRMLGLFSGSDVRSATIVIGAFLAGLGVGSLLGGVWADRLDSRQAVRAFGICNFGIAIFAVLSRFLFYDLLFRELSTLARWPALMLLVAFISLLWPTMLMGLSLPLLSKAIVRSMHDAPGLISLLYGINTLGSGLGTLAAGWYLIGTLGYHRTVYVGAAISTLVGLTALLLAPGFRAESQGASKHVATRLNLRRIPREVWGWCALVCASGFISIALELLWFRILEVLLEPNAYTFAHLLAFILLGYAIGSLIGSVVVRWIHDPRRAFLWMQGLIVLYSVGIVLLLYQRYESMVATPLAGSKGYIPDPGAVLRSGSGFVFGYITLPAVLLLPPNILIGLNFPIVQKAVQTRAALIGQRVGLVQVANIVGNTLGSIVTGLFLLERFGTAGSLRVVGVLGVLFAFVLAWQNLKRVRIPGLVGALALALLLGITSVRLPPTNSLWARLHGGTEPDSLVAENSTGIALLQGLNGTAKMYADGMHQGDIPFIDIHTFLGSLPALVHPEPKRALVVGIGSGGTPYGVGANPATEEVVAVELNGSELVVLRGLAETPHGQPIQALLDDPRYRIVIGDGRRELALTTDYFDIIEADAILPWRSHSGLLYSQEFFEQARARLAEGGIMAQWAKWPRTQNTFKRVFPYGVQVGEEIMLGSLQPIAFDKETVLLRLDDPRVVEYLTRGRVDVNLMRETIVNSSITFWTPEDPREGEINTDLFPKDEYYLNNID